jgi:glutathionylspermidine synthase
MRKFEQPWKLKQQPRWRRRIFALVFVIFLARGVLRRFRRTWILIWRRIVRREPSPRRPNFSEEAAEIGFNFAHIDGEPYWDESVRYVFSMREIEEDLESATVELNALCLELVSRLVASEEGMQKLQIPRHAWDLIAESWARRDPSLYGRFDFAYDGHSKPKLLEFNADTPTSVFETAVVQWRWLEQLIGCGELPQKADQFNSLHEKLIARWREVIARGPLVHLACMAESVEDRGTVAYLEDCALQADLRTAVIGMGDIGLDEDVFVDRSEREIRSLFKLYPWEWMFADPFGQSTAIRRARFIEPPWKALLANKGALALLWEMAPGHSNLLPCFFENDARALTLKESFARKPLYSREGANIALVDGGETIVRTSGDYGSEGYVRQALHMLPKFGGHYPVLGCWLVGDEPAGMGVREDVSPITSNQSRFVPHAIID